MNLADVSHRVLVATAHLGDKQTRGGRLWRRALGAAERRWGDEIVNMNLHGRSLAINYANPYPYYVRRHAHYNAPQVEAIALAAEASGRRVVVLDVGSAIGDTALMLFDVCGQLIEEMHCVEAEPDFVSLLGSNLAGLPVSIHAVMLSADSGPVRRLIRSEHQGTASALGDEEVPSVRLGALGVSPDVVKIDTDGFDGEVLAGGTEVLAAQPVVLFEWHPRMCQIVGSDPYKPFATLAEAGYSTFIFYDKFGDFSHVMKGIDLPSLQSTADLCTDSRTLIDWHYDVLAVANISDGVLVRTCGLERWSVLTGRLPA